MREGLRPTEREAFYADDRCLNAYYFGFDSTGVPEVDAILSAVAYAGKGYHHTDEWGGGESRFGEDRPYGDVIQAAANEAANRWDALAAVLPDLLAEANKRAEDAEAKARRFANLLGNNAKTLNDTLPREALRQKAAAFDECTRAWEAYLSGTSGNVPPLNPYRQDSEGTEAGA